MVVSCTFTTWRISVIIGTFSELNTLIVRRQKHGFPMNRLLLISLLALIFGVVGCQQQTSADIGIYLLAEDGPATQLAERDLNTIALQEQPVISINDIISYDRNSHEMQLTGAAYRRVQELFPLPVRVDGIPFVVRVGDEPIYAGAFWTPLSSLSYDGVIIMQPFGDQDEKIGLALGYPGQIAFTGEDPRGIPESLKHWARRAS
jgi:hypothetical protein